MTDTNGEHDPEVVPSWRVSMGKTDVLMAGVLRAALRSHAAELLDQPVPLCPVCGRPAEQRAWCSQECEDFEATGQKPA